ncbi:ataxin-7 isoform X2 [Ictalurus furcatus]|uniref:ataxin-7 isoform X2 n=1 Tax=Ictalurus furcatus TaxID=66913 RepID=UPI002350D0B7|nr:ataxin-7 isoform X2 [Ictalurus furcatus]
MSERDEEGEPRAEQRARAPPRHQQQRTEGASAMAAIGERAASLPSPEVMLGQAWSCWVDAAKLHATDGIEPEESFKECGRNREAMRLCRDDMPIFGQCPAQDDFYLVMCSHCSQVVKPQAFQAHFERRHSSINKPASSYSSSAALPGLPSRARTGGAGGGGPASTMPVGSSSSSSSAGGSNNTHTAKEKLPHRKPHFPPKVLHNDILTPAVKVEKIHVKMDYVSSKPGHVPASSSSSSCSTVSSSPSKPGLNSQSVPKAHQASPGHIPNGKSHLSPLSKKQDSSTNASSKRPPRKVLEREFNPDVHCGVMDIGARKPCTRSLTCKTHSLSQRRAVPGRRKRFDVLLAEHKGRAREKELQQQPHRTEPSQQTPPPLRETHPPSHHGNPTATTDATKLFPLSKTKPHNPVLPRSSHSGLSSLGDAAATPDPTLHPHLALTPDGAACPSSDEGENEEREESMDKLDCHYSGYHPRPASFCTFGSRLFGRSCYLFDRRWDRVQYALVAMMDKHVNSLMWKKIPLALENSSSSSSSFAAVTSSHRSSTNSLSSSSGFLSPSPPPPYSQSHDSKPTLSYGTTLNARVTSQRAGEQLAYSGGGSSRQVSSSSPQMPSAHSSSLPSAPGSNKSIKSRTGPKHFWVKEPSPASLASSSANNNSSSSDTSGVSVSSSSAISLGSTKKRKNSSLKYGAESSPSSSSSSLKKNCMANSGTSGSSFHSSLTSTAASMAFSSSSSSSSSHSAGMNCPPGRGNSMSARQEAAEPIKRMSVMMNSSDSTLSLGPFVNNPDGRTDTKRRKSSQATSSLAGTATCTASAAGGGGAQGPGRPKMAKSPAINNIHGKHARPMPGTPGLPNNSLIHQVCMDLMRVYVLRKRGAASQFAYKY